MTAAPPAEQWHRLHPRMLLIHPVTELVRVLPVLAGLLLAGHGNVGRLLGGVGVAALVTALAISRWFTTRLRITAEQVELRHGLLRRRSLATRRDRIRTVDVTAHLLHRLLGLSRVVIGTGTSDRKGRDKLVLDGLTAPAARRLRDDLLHPAPAGATPASSAVGRSADAPQELARLDPRWIRYAPFTLSGVVTGLIVWGFLWRLQGDGVDVLHSGPFRALTRDTERLSTTVLAIGVVLLLAVFVTVTSLGGYVLAFWNFRLARHPSGTLEVTRGLITARSTSIERPRLAGVRVSEPLPLRVVGGARLLAVATGLRVGRGAEKGGEALLPPAPAAAVLGVGRDVLDGARVLDVDLLAHGPGALRRRRVRALAGSLVLLGAAIAGWATGGSGWPVAVGVLVALAAPALARDRYASLGHAVCERYLVARSGTFVRRRTALHADSIIGWNLRSSVFQRRADLTTLVATTAAGRQAETVADVPLAEALAVADSLTPGLLAQFRVAARPATRPATLP